MSHLVLARKYRPRNSPKWSARACGQVDQQCADVVVQGCTHAYLFTGTRALVRRRCRASHKSLNRLAGRAGRYHGHPPGVRQACQDIDGLLHRDYTELDAARTGVLTRFSPLLEQAVYKPVQGRFVFFMIDEAHMLTNHAFNAMLKTLEEPPCVPPSSCSGHHGPAKVLAGPC